MNRVKNALKWGLLGCAMIVLTVIMYFFEKGRGGRYKYTALFLVLSIGCFVVTFIDIFDKNQFVKGTLIVEDVFTMTRKGCVVVGYVEGRLQNYEKIIITDKNNNKIQTKIYSMEIGGISKICAIDTKAALFLKDIEPNQVHKEDIIENIKAD